MRYAALTHPTELTIGLHEAREVPEDLQQNPEFAAAVAQSKAASQQQQ